MKKTRLSRLGFYLAFLLLTALLVAIFLSVTAYAETGCQESDSGISTVLPQNRYLVDEPISITYRVRSEASITSFTYNSQGFAVLSSGVSSEDPKEINVVIAPTGTWESAAFSIQVLLSSGEAVGDRLYATQNEHGIFVSIFSLDSSYREYLQYAVDEGLLTWEESEELFARRGAACVEETVTTVLLPTQIGDSASTNTTGSANTYVSGTLSWKDDYGVTHPLRGVKVEAYDYDSFFQDDFLGTTYTNDQGSFSIGFINDTAIDESGRDLYIIVYAGDDNITVKTLDGNSYFYETNVKNNVATGSNTTFNITFSMTDGTGTEALVNDADLGRAMQIGQAAMTARDYAEAMMGSTPAAVTVYYPGALNSRGEKGCFYDQIEIHITDEEREKEENPYSYASWDVVMHEYGHHIQELLNIADSPGGGHWIDFNQMEYYHHPDNEYKGENIKEDGVKLAWAEGWATTFGQVAQHYYRDELQNIDTVNNGQYDAYNLKNPSLIENSATALGEGSESSIIAVLWDLFDSFDEDEPEDTIYLGYHEFWDITTISGTYTFSDFIGHFYLEYPAYCNAIGYKLSEYGMATSIPHKQNSNAKPHTILFNAQGGSAHYPNNDLVVYVYDQAGNQLFTASYAEPVSSYSDLYKLTFSAVHWQVILDAPGATYKVKVAAYQNSTYDTGGYLSPFSEPITKPATEAPSPLITTTSIAASTRYKEYIPTLQSGQYIDYVITFHSSCTYIIQTFGTQDAQLYLFDIDGGFLAFDEDSGYSVNALLCHTVTEGSKYIVRVKLSYTNAASAQVKVAFSPTDSIIDSYEDFHGGSSNVSAYSSSIAKNDAAYYRYTPATSEQWIQFEADATFNSYLYLIDPRSTKPITDDFDDYTLGCNNSCSSCAGNCDENCADFCCDYCPGEGCGAYGGIESDYGGSGTDALFSQPLQEDVPYLVIVTAFNPAYQSGIFTLWIDEFDS